jgi:ferric-dicitrate binding protein FerR (iron transport regulator)
MNEREPLMDEDDEGATRRLLRLSGPRSAVPQDRATRVRAAVYGNWQTQRRRRVVRRRVVVGSLLTVAAALTVIAARVADGDRAALSPGTRVAVVERIEGAPERGSDATARRTAGSLAPEDAVYSGEWIDTDAQARVALRFADGTSLRLDVRSRVRALSGSLVELESGAVYVDTGRENGRFEVRTPFAIARDIGTQFEVRLIEQAVRVRVRSGTVQVTDAVRTVAGHGGTEVTLSAAGAVSRPVSPHGSEWQWTTTVFPPLIIEGLPLSTVLVRIAHENGWRLVYDDPALEREATGTTLHGTVSGLAADEALDVAMRTSGLVHHLADGQLVVLRPVDPK